MGSLVDVQQLEAVAATVRARGSRMHPFVVLAIVDYTEVLATPSSQVLAAR